MPLCHQIAPIALRSKRDTTWTFPPWQLLRPEHPCFRLCRILLIVQLSPAVKDPRNPRKGTGKTHTFQGPFPPITCTTERTLSQGKLSTAISVSSGICYLLWLQHSAFHLEWGFKMWEMYHYLLPPPGGTYTWRSRLWQTPWSVPDSPAAGPWLSHASSGSRCWSQVLAFDLQPLHPGPRAFYHLKPHACLQRLFECHPFGFYVRVF